MNQVNIYKMVITWDFLLKKFAWFRERLTFLPDDRILYKTIVMINVVCVNVTTTTTTTDF